MELMGNCTWMRPWIGCYQKVDCRRDWRESPVLKIQIGTLMLMVSVQSKRSCTLEILMLFRNLRCFIFVMFDKIASLTTFLFLPFVFLILSRLSRCHVRIEFIFLFN